jgi:hypothetical protein
MEIQGIWKKDPEGFMEFETYQLQRLYEAITDQYHKVYNHYLDDLDDEEAASLQARKDGYQMITDYKVINGREEFATTYITPSYTMDIWYELDEISRKRIYEKGFIRILGK